MKISLVFVSSLVLLSLVGCSKPSPEEQKKKEAELTSAFASAFAAQTAEAPKGAAKTVSMETKTLDKFGAKISVPQGAKVLSDDAFGTSFSFDLGDLNEIGVSISNAVGVTNLKSAVEDATMMGEKKLEAQTEVDKTTIQLIKAPQFGTVFVYQYKKLKAGWVKASCNGPVQYKAKIVEACSSLAAK